MLSPGYNAFLSKVRKTKIVADFKYLNIVKLKSMLIQHMNCFFLFVNLTMASANFIQEYLHNCLCQMIMLICNT